MTRRYLTLKEASEFTGFSESTLYGYVNQRKIPFIKKGRLRFDRLALEKWMQDDAKEPVARDAGQ